MNVNTEIRLLRLNYEWCKLVDVIKNLDATIWDNLYKMIQNCLSEILGDYTIAIGSEYSIIDDCIRQIPELYDELMTIYEALTNNYRSVLGLNYMLSYMEISQLLRSSKTGSIRMFDDINILFRIINTELANDGYLDDSGIYVNDSKYHGFQLTINNMSLLNAMDINMSNINSERFINDVKLYIDAIITYEILIYKSETDPIEKQ